MGQIVSLNFPQVKKHGFWILSAALPLVLFLVLYPHYVRNNTFLWICLITMPISVGSTSHAKPNFAFRLALAMGIISLILPTVIGIYMVAFLIGIVLLEKIFGGSHFTLMIHFLLASPLFSYFSSLISFPVRLQLSAIVTRLLQFAGMDVEIDGNLVILGDTSFMVDEACAGMHMLGYGLLFGTVTLSFCTRNSHLSLKHLVMYCALLIALILIGNICRITLLIVFHIMPDQWMHEGLGLLVYVLQILIPFYLIVNYRYRGKEIKEKHPKSTRVIFPTKRYLTLCTLLLLMIGRQLHSGNKVIAAQSPVYLPGYETSIVNESIVKLINDQSLIYIKPPVKPYRADHNPMICWQGSGYDFKKIEKWKINNLLINHAELIKGEEKIYTAWWFQSKQTQTGNQLEWRKHSLLNGEDFYLINVTCHSKKALHRELQTIIKQNVINHHANS